MIVPWLLDRLIQIQLLSWEKKGNWFAQRLEWTVTSLCEWIAFRWQPHHYVICLFAKGNWFAQRLEWTVVCQRSRSPHPYLRTEIHSLIRYNLRTHCVNELPFADSHTAMWSVCLRKTIIRIKVWMDNSLSAQPISSSSYLRTEIHSHRYKFWLRSYHYALFLICI